MGRHLSASHTCNLVSGQMGVATASAGRGGGGGAGYGPEYSNHRKFTLFLSGAQGSELSRGRGCAPSWHLGLHDGLNLESNSVDAELHPVATWEESSGHWPYSWLC